MHTPWLYRLLGHEVSLLKTHPGCSAGIDTLDDAMMAGLYEPWTWPDVVPESKTEASLMYETRCATPCHHTCYSAV